MYVHMLGTGRLDGASGRLDGGFKKKGRERKPPMLFALQSFLFSSF